MKSFLNKLIIKRNFPNFIKRLRYKIKCSILLIHLFPFFKFFLSQKKLFWWIIGLIVTWQFLLHWGNVNNTPFRDCAAGPSIKQHLLFLLFFLLLVPGNSPAQKSIKDFVHLHSLPFRRHEISFCRRKRIYRKWIIMLNIDAIILSRNRF